MKRHASCILYLASSIVCLACFSPPLAQDPQDLIDLGVKVIIFVERFNRAAGDGHWYANFGYFAPSFNHKTYQEGARLLKLDVHSRDVTAILETDTGGIRDPFVHYDGKTILFSYRKDDSPHYHLYEIQADRTGLKQLTDGRYDDFEPCCLPDGDIMFVSGRGKRWVNCWRTQVGTLHRCDRDGKNIRLISANVEQDNTPWVLPDGRIVYMRWEYVDRKQTTYHHLWTANPDGTEQMVLFGNQRPGGLFIAAKPIPNSDKIVLTSAPGHGKGGIGPVAVLSPPAHPDDHEAMKEIARGAYVDPWAFSEDLFMAGARKDLVLLSGSGKKTVLHTVAMNVHEPRPLIPSEREPIIPPRINLKNTTGTLMLIDVYTGRNMGRVKRGSIKKLLIMESLPKPINYTGGMEPMSACGTFMLERVLGTVPVEADGSAHFEVPANRPLILAALDQKNQAVRRMQSFLSVAPGGKKKGK